MQAIRLFAVAILAILCTAAAPMKTYPISISIDDAFVKGRSTMEVWFAAQNGPPLLLPKVRVELGETVVFDGRLKMEGHPKSHLYFGNFQAAIRTTSPKIVFRFSVPENSVRFEKEVDLSRGSYFQVGRSNEEIVIEQFAKTRYYH